MPDRILRESIRFSASLADCSDGAERLFHRLVVTADDFGRFDARPAVVRSQCFPLLIDQWPEERVIDALGELETTEHISRYAVEGRDYGCFTNWPKHQRIRAARSKFPGPDDNGQHPTTDDGGRDLARAPARGSLLASRFSLSDSLRKGGFGGVDEAFDAFWAVYPRRQGKRAARAAFERAITRELASDIIAAAERFRDDPNREDPYTAHPTTWLNQDRWEDDPLPPRNSGKARTVSNILALADRVEER